MPDVKKKIEKIEIEHKAECALREVHRLLRDTTRPGHQSVDLALGEIARYFAATDKAKLVDKLRAEYKHISDRSVDLREQLANALDFDDGDIVDRQVDGCESASKIAHQLANTLYTRRCLLAQLTQESAK